MERREQENMKILLKISAFIFVCIIGTIIVSLWHFYIVIGASESDIKYIIELLPLMIIFWYFADKILDKMFKNHNQKDCDVHLTYYDNRIDILSDPKLKIKINNSSSFAYLEVNINDIMGPR